MTKYAFHEGEIRSITDARVSVMTHTFNYGTGCFGGIRGYWSADDSCLYVFRLLDHYQRFLDSGKLILANIEYSAKQLATITLELLAREGWREDCYIRPILYKADELIGVRLHNLRDEVSIFSVPMGQYLPNEDGVRACTSSWRRVDDTAVPARGKLIGSYVNSALIKSDAQLSGFDEAIVLNQDGHVAEASAANLVMIRDQVLITPPVHGNVLEGITLRSLLSVAERDFGLAHERRDIDRTELYLADEVFLCGTGVQIAAVTSIDHRTIGDGNVGPITRRLRKRYFDIVRGRVPEYGTWLTPVPEPVTAQK